MKNIIKYIDILNLLELFLITLNFFIFILNQTNNLNKYVKI